MKRLLVAILAAGAAISVASCSHMPDWMPGSGAVKVSLGGAEEVPPVSTAAKGRGSFRVADDGSVSGSVTTEGVAGTMAHIHLGARGKNGPVIVPLAKNGDTYSVPEGRKLTAEQVKAFKEGGLYVNVHSAAHRGGEIRAQLQP
jgi:CHRD domain